MHVVERFAQLLTSGEVESARALEAELARIDDALAEIAREALAGHAEPARTRLHLAAMLLMVGARELSIDTAREALSLDAAPRTRSGVASIFVAAGHHAEALQLLQGVIAETPEDRDAHINLATASFKLGEHGAAMTHYARAFELDPSDLTPIHNLMSMFAELGKWLGAMAALDLSRRGEPPPEVAVALDLASIQITQRIASAYPTPGLDADSDRTVRDLITNVGKRGVRTQLVAARALISIARYAEAARLIQAIAKSPTLDASARAELHYCEGLLAEHDEYIDTALERYLRAIAQDPTRTDAATNAVSLLIGSGYPDALPRIGALLAQLDQAARTQSPTLAFNEARYLHQRGEIDDARACLMRVLELTGGRGELATLARRALVELGS